MTCDDRKGSELAKRLFDIALAALVFAFSLPLWLLVAAMIKLEDGGRVFYLQERVGRNGRLFLSRKFRSMIESSHRWFGSLQACDGDPRVTRVGRFLRVTALDELPQVWNILVGDMSWVGPRPLLSAEIEVNGDGQLIPLEKIPGCDERHRVRPGLTGLAQVYQPRNIARPQKFKFDLLYIRKQTLYLDLKLIALSVWISLRGRWESRDKKL